MNITLGTRTAENAAVYFEKTQAEPIRLFLPQEAKTLDEALASFRASLLPGAKSFGRTILLDGRYVGDVWCHGIDRDGEPQAMVSYCVFETDCWNQGVATEALRLFLIEVREHFDLNVFGAFTYEENAASRRVLEKNGFLLKQRFKEDGAASCYYERVWQEDKLEEMSDFFTARLEGYDEHWIVVSETEVQDGRVISCRKRSAFKISTAEASMMLSRNEYVTVFEILTQDMEPFDQVFDIYSLGMTRTDHETGEMFMEFKPDNSHAELKEFNLSDDIEALYYVTDYGQLIVAAYSLEAIQSAERRIAKSPVAAVVLPTAKYNFAQSILYEFAVSGYTDFGEFLESLDG